MRNGIIILFLCGMIFSALGMKRVGTCTEDLVSTAQFISESSCISPLQTPHTSPRGDLSSMEQVPRSATSCIYALMDRYDLHVDFTSQQTFVYFPDYMEPAQSYSLPLLQVSEWVRILRKNALTSAHAESVCVNPAEMNGDQRDLQNARKKLSAFILCRDLLSPDILVKEYTHLLACTRRLRLDAFEKKNIPGLIASKYHSVQYHQIPYEKSSQFIIETSTKSKSCNCILL